MLGLKSDGKDDFFALHVYNVCDFNCYDFGWIISVIMETMLEERVVFYSLWLPQTVDHSTSHTCSYETGYKSEN